MQNILWCVSGSIALYKSLELIRDLVREKYSVSVAMTAHACRFVQPLSFAVLSGKAVYVDLFEDPLAHVRLADEADLCVVAPASYNLVGKLAHGIADDLVSTLLSVVQCQKILVPAMNARMYENAACERNIAVLREEDYCVVEPEYGDLACGHVGVGRFPRKDRLLNLIRQSLSVRSLPALRGILRGKRVCITCGGTREALDPVRYIGNYSSGKMGLAMAEAFMNVSAEVHLIHAHTDVTIPPEIQATHAPTAEEMLKILQAKSAWADILIMAAAVSDYRPQHYSEHKLKKDAQTQSFTLHKTPDILHSLNSTKRADQIFIGFAAESEKILENAREKLTKKKLDMIIVNDISRKDIGFSSEHNEVEILFPDKTQKSLPKMPKSLLSIHIIDTIAQAFYKKTQSPDSPTQTTQR